MPEVVQTFVTNLTSGQTVQNALQGTKLENVPTDAQAYQVTVLATADDFAVEHILEADTDVAIQRSTIGNQSTLQRPKDPDDYVTSFLVSGGTKLYLEIDNTDGAAGHDAAHTIYLDPVR